MGNVLSTYTKSLNGNIAYLSQYSRLELRKKKTYKRTETLND